MKRLIITLFAAMVANTVVAEQTGQQLFEQYCLHCHGGTVKKAPPLSLLQIMSASSVYRATTVGIMQEQSAGLSEAQQRLVAEYLTGQSLADSASAMPPACENDFDAGQPPTSVGWGVDLGNSRFFGEQQTSLTAADIPDLELKWAFAYPDAMRARSQPGIAGGMVYVGGQDGSVFALDRESGCLHWRFSTVAEVRTAIVVGPASDDSGSGRLLYFGDLVGNVYAISAETGELVWRDRPDDHPSLTLTAAPALHDGRLYVPMSALEVTAAADPEYACCTFRGGVAVYDAKAGSKLFTAYTIDEPPRKVGVNSVGTDRIAPSGAPIWNTPVIDPARKAMYVGTGENYSSPANDTSDAILALSMEDGRILWSQQMTAGDAWNMGCETEEKINCPPENGPDYDFGAAAILAQTSDGRSVILAGQKSGDVFALDPDNGGRILWQHKLGRGGIQGGVHFGMAVDGDTLYVPMSDFDGGPRWPGVARPGMYALDIPSGEVLWFTPALDTCEELEFCQPGLSAPASALPGGVVGGAMDGHLRLYDKASGNVSWVLDSLRKYQTVNGVTAQGGSFGGGTGAVFDGDMMFVNSGYGIYFHMPGNVLLAFGPRD